MVTYFKKMRRRYQIASIALFIVAVVGVSGYVFFMKTLRGNSLALYMVGGWHAPLGVRYDCGKETDVKVHDKFLQRLDFDTHSKNLLQNFWFYSFYRQCLYNHGYTFKGNSVLPSSVQDTLYRNELLGVTMTVPAGSTITKDNALNVEFDDQLFVSELHAPAGDMHVQVEVSHPQIHTFDDALGFVTHIPGTQGTIVTKEPMKNVHNIPYLFITQDNDTVGIVAVGEHGKVVVLYGDSSMVQVLHNSVDSLQISPSTKL